MVTNEEKGGLAYQDTVTYGAGANVKGSDGMIYTSRLIPVTTASYVRSWGFDSLSQVVKLSGWPRSTLIDMYNKHPVRFEVVLMGCREKQEYNRLANDQEIAL